MLSVSSNWHHQAREASTDLRSSEKFRQIFRVIPFQLPSKIFAIPPRIPVLTNHSTACTAATRTHSSPAMPIILIKRILATCCADRVSAVVSDDVTARKRQNHALVINKPRKKMRKVPKGSPFESLPTTLGSEGYVQWLEHQWKARTADFDATVAQRAALLAKASLVEYEKILCEKLAQQAQAILKQKELELSTIMAQNEQALSMLQTSFEDAKAIHDEMEEFDSTAGKMDRQTAMSLFLLK